VECNAMEENCMGYKNKEAYEHDSNSQHLANRRIYQADIMVFLTA
jgi:hypothetical protein